MCSDRMMRGFAAAVAVVVLLGRAAVSFTTAMTPLREFSAALPAGEGKILVFKYCVACHGAQVARNRLENGRWMSDAWESLMQAEELDPLSQYLNDTFGSSSGASPEKADTLETLLPAGAPKTTFLEKCVSCHNREEIGRRIESRRGVPPSVWNRILVRMRNYGAPLTGEEINELSLYLGSAFKSAPTESNPVRELNSFLPDAPGRELVMAECLACHGASELKRRLEQAQRGAANYWSDVITRMKDRWEAPLEPEDIKILVGYLRSLTRQ